MTFINNLGINQKKKQIKLSTLLYSLVIHNNNYYIK